MRAKLVSLLVLTSVSGVAYGSATTGLDWDAVEGVAAAARVDRVAALALNAATGDLAVGDERGVAVGRPGAAFVRVARSAPVRDLAFLPASIAAGALLAATADGVVLVAGDGRVETRSPGPAAAARDAHRIAAVSEVVALATGDGVFLSGDGRRWSPLRSVARGPATAIALRRRDGALDAWVVVSGELWRTRLESESGTWRGRDGRRVAVASVGGARPVDVRVDVGDAEVAILYSRAVAVRHEGDATWRVHRPQLPPGAQSRRLLVGAGGFWLATDRGLLRAEALEGPWRRARHPLGSAPVRGFDGDALAIYVATADGVRTGRVASPHAQARAAAEFPDDPSISVVYQAALAYLRLQPWRSDAMRKGVERRGWLPVVDLSLGTDWDETRTTERDQSFLSGDTRDLLDRDRQRSTDYEVSLRFSWDLGDIAYHPEQIDVSREAREVIELRDNVLDEIVQLYFERRRVLGELAGLGGPTGDDGLRLRLRAAELAAGLDAWTGGWFSRHAAVGP